MPRAFSSFSRSASTPVSARTRRGLAVVDVAGGADDHRSGSGSGAVGGAAGARGLLDGERVLGRAQERIGERAAAGLGAHAARRRRRPDRAARRRRAAARRRAWPGRRRRRGRRRGPTSARPRPGRARRRRRCGGASRAAPSRRRGPGRRRRGARRCASAGSGGMISPSSSIQLSMSCASASPACAARAVELGGAARVLRHAVAAEVGVREVAAAGRVAGLRRQRQPLQRERRVALHAEAVGEAGADVVLRPRVAGLRQRPPDRQRRRRSRRGGRRPRRAPCASVGLGGRRAASQVTARGPPRLARKRASSSRQRRSRTSAPSAMRPITGTGSARKAAARSRTDWPPPRRSRGADREAGARHASRSAARRSRSGSRRRPARRRSRARPPRRPPGAAARPARRSRPRGRDSRRRVGSRAARRSGSR